MKWLNFDKVVVFILLLFSAASIKGQEMPRDTVYVYITDTLYLQNKSLEGYEQRKKEFESRWKKLIPSYYKAQFAGSMGLISVGTGWSYGKNKQWETDLLFGFVPKYSTRHNKATMTLKQNFIPWTVRISDKIDLKPFSTGLYINTVFGSDFWGKQPSKYPNGYYQFSPKIRFNIFMGQGWVYNLDTARKSFCKSITLFYEVSTNELYLISAATNRYLKAKDFLGLSFGVKLQFL